MASEQDTGNPFALFRLGYSLFSWFSLVGTALITVWLLWTLFVNTPDGTAGRARMLAVAPTLTAVASGRPTADPNAPAVVALPATCAGCHAIEGTDSKGVTCPDLSRIGAVAAQRIAAADYTGSATTVEAYIRESIVQPAAYIVKDKAEYALPAGGSLMPANAAEAAGLDDASIDAIVAYLASLR